MKTYLVTGAAGFIGANYLKYILKKYDDVRVVALDLLTYAGYLGTIAEDIDDERCFFVRGDIGDRKLVDELFATYHFDVVVNFAAESHVDRSIENPQLFLQTNILGTQNLLDCARRDWVTGKDEQGYPTWKAGVRFHQVSTDESMAVWAIQDSLRKIRRSSPTALILRQRRVRTWWSALIATRIVCPSASRAAQTTMGRINFRRNSFRL